MPGQRPKPTAQKLATGNPGKRKLNFAEPRYVAGIPACPSYLTPTAKKIWHSLGKRLNEAKVISKADGVALELLVAAYADWRAACEVVEREGSTYEVFVETPAPTPTAENPDASAAAATVQRASIRTHPAVGIAAAAWRRVKLMLTEFALTPATRSKVSALPGAQVADAFELMLDGRKSA